MSTSESTLRAFSADPAENEPANRNYEVQRYSKSAIAALVLGILSLLSFVDMALIILSIFPFMLGIYSWLNIRRYPKEFKGAWIAVAAIALGPVASGGALAVDAIRLQAEIPEGYRYSSWSDLQPGEDSAAIIPPLAQELNGQKVYVRGYVYPSKKRNGLKKFVLVRDRGTCCFGGQPKLTDMIVVDLKNEQSINYSLWLRGIGGTWNLKPPNQKIDEIVSGYYEIEADTVR